MIDVKILTDSEGGYTGFTMHGHAEYAEYGQDIVCAAVSALVINTMNSVEAFTEDAFSHAIHEKEDEVSFQITSHPVSASSELLLKSLVLGLQAIESEYGKKHVHVYFEKNQEV